MHKHHPRIWMLIVSLFFHERIMEATVLLGTFSAFVVLCSSVPRHNPVSELCRQLFQPNYLDFVLIHIVSYQIDTSNQFSITTKSLQSRCLNIHVCNFKMLFLINLPKNRDKIIFLYFFSAEGSRTECTESEGGLNTF